MWSTETGHLYLEGFTEVFVFSRWKQNTEVSCLYMFEAINDTAVKLKPLLTVCGSVESPCITGGVAFMLIRQTK